MQKEIEQAQEISKQENEMFQKIFKELFGGFFDNQEVENAKSN